MLNILLAKFSDVISLTKQIKKPPIYYYAKNSILFYLLNRQLKKELCSSSIIMVYQIGKVGSTTVYETIEKAIKNHPVYHIHSLDPKKINKRYNQINLYEDYRKDYGWETVKQIFISKYLINQLDKILKKKNLKIITIVRDPIAREISSFFEANRLRLELKSMKIEDLIEIFWKQKNLTNRQGNWLNNELNNYLGIDVYSIDFPKDKGHKIVRDNDKRIEILLLKLERFEKDLRNSLIEFFGLDEIIIKTRRRTQNTNYFDTYNLFKNSIIFPTEFLEEIYGQPWIRHFYTEEEIEKFKIKWSRNANK
jgi:hypothetical protein